jgi:hypothetical protein
MLFRTSLRDAPEVEERVLQAVDQRRHILARIEPAPADRIGTSATARC